MASITRAPSGKVSYVNAPKRNTGTQTFTTSWKIPSSHTDSDNNARATGIEVQWELGMGRKDKKGKSNNPYISRTGSTGWTSDTLQLNQGWKFTDKVNYTRKSFFPYVESNQLYNVHIWIRETNSKGNGSWVKMTRAIERPYAPVLSQPSHDTSTGIVACQIQQNRDESGYCPCERTIYRKSIKSANGEWTVSQDMTKSTDFTVWEDISQQQQIGYNDYIQIRFEAWAQGYWYDNKKDVYNSSAGGVQRTVKGVKGAVRDIYISYPFVPTIKDIWIGTAQGEVSQSPRTSTNKVTILIDVNKTTEHPVTGCRLQKLVNVDYDTVDDIPADANWQDTESRDNGLVTALAASVPDLIPAAGKKTWIRVKTWNNDEEVYFRTSEPVRLTQLEIPAPSAADDDIVLCELIPDEDGESVIAVFGWNADGEDDANYTELTWSDNENAWRSTDPPSLHDFSWSDGPMDWTDYTDPNNPVEFHFQDSARIHIENLAEGVIYYVRGRRVKETDIATTYSEYTATKTVIPSQTPASVTLMAPSFVARGDSVPFTWTYSSEEMQTSWALLIGSIETQTDPTTEESVEVFIESNVVDTGTDSSGSCVIDGERFASLVEGADSAIFAVRISMGGAFIESNAVKVSIADIPVLTVTAPTVITGQQPEISYTCTTQSNISLVVLAQGMQGEYPDGVRTQIYGDTIFTDTLSPDWTEGNDILTATSTLPPNLDFWDGGSYILRAIAIDRDTGLASELVQQEFTVNWEHQAPVPSGDISVIPFNSVDEEGYSRIGVVIRLDSPETAHVDDVYDIYRITRDGTYLIARDQGQHATVIDPYAPYGCRSLDNALHYYRIATRTADGDVDWLDYPYLLIGPDLRLDFGDSYIELPYNVSVGDSYTKDFEARAHLGSATPEGYWNENINHRTSLSTDMIRMSDRGQLDTLRQAARFDGPIFVRTATGNAFQADVEINGMDDNYNTVIVPVTLDAT